MDDFNQEEDTEGTVTSSPLSEDGDDAWSDGVEYRGGFDADFDTPLPTDFTCCICFLAFREPMQLPCGHQFCKTCLEACKETQVFFNLKSLYTYVERYFHCRAVRYFSVHLRAK